MDERTEGRIAEWPTRGFSGGYDGLSDLEDDSFSGVVEADAGPWLCMLNGTVLGVFDGRIEDFDDASGTAKEAPHEGLPLLFAMRETGGDLEQQYYTKDTPVSEADRTLSSGSFTGYVELSENVLSGDYYVCYYGGQSISLAFVGSSERLLTDEEAFDRADNEVGIYDVYSVDLDPVRFPGSDGEPESKSESESESESGSKPGSGSDVAPDTKPDTEPDGDTESSTDQTDVETDRTVDALGTDASEDRFSGFDARFETGSPDGVDTATDDTATENAGADDGFETTDPDVRADTASADGTDAGSKTGTPERSRLRDHTPDADPTDDTRSDRSDPTDTNGDTDTKTNTDTDANTTDAAPASAPDRSSSPSTDRRASTTAESADIGRETDVATDTRPHRGTDPRQRTGANADPGVDTRPRGGSDPRAERALSAVDDFRDTLSEHADAINRLGERVAGTERDQRDLEGDHDRVVARVDGVENDLRDLRRTVEQLRSEVRNLGTESADDRRATNETANETSEAASERDTPSMERADTERQALSPTAAMAGTNLLVRYDSKSQATLSAAHAGNADYGGVNGNLRLDAVTTFDDEGVTVDGRPYRDFLTSTMQYQFVEWLVRDLLFELRETANADALGALYDAIPRIDRVEMDGTVEVPAPEDAEESVAERLDFEVVVRDSVGAPLIVANFNDSRDPATQKMVVELEGGSSTLAGPTELSAAFLVTRSFFEPAALETVEEATGGSLLSRDSKKSFVRLSRRRGYHLCLVESREGDFHVNVPEL